MSTLPMTDGSKEVDAIPGAPQARDRCELVRDFARLEELASEWELLWASDPEGEVFQCFRWNRAWWEAFGDSVRLFTPVVFHGEQVVGILPLVERGGRLESLGAPQADYGDVICREADTVRVLTASLAALQQQAGWGEAALEGVAAHSRIARHFHELPESCRANLQLTFAENCYTVLLAGDAGVLDGLARKQHLRRRQNKLEKAGKAGFRHILDRAEALEHLELFFVSQRRRRAVQGKASASEQVGFQNLLRNLVRTFDLRDELHFGVLELEGRPLAWHLSFETNEKLVFYQQTFAIDGWDLAPGEALLRYLLLFAKDRVHREFDFTRGDEPFKARFANCERPVYTLYVQRAGAVGRARGFARSLGARAQALTARARAAAKSDKAVFERWRSLRTWVRERSSRARLQPGLMVKELRDSVWRRHDVTIWESRASSASPPSQESFDLRVSAGSLGELVDFAQAHPEVVLPTEILELRDRLKNGDRLLIARRRDQIEQVAWASTRPVDEILGIPKDLVNAFGPALSVYESWVARSSGEPAVAEALLAALRQEAATLRLPLRVCSQEGRRGVRVRKAQNQFDEKARISWSRILGRDILKRAAELHGQ